MAFALKYCMWHLRAFYIPWIVNWFLELNEFFYYKSPGMPRLISILKIFSRLCSIIQTQEGHSFKMPSIFNCIASLYQKLIYFHYCSNILSYKHNMCVDYFCSSTSLLCNIQRLILQSLVITKYYTFFDWEIEINFL